MIEVLISVLILSFGVISMGGLQLAALKSNQIAGYSSTAATLARDYPLLMAILFVVSMMVILVNLLTDLIYAFLDPRIRFE